MPQHFVTPVVVVLRHLKDVRDLLPPSHPTPFWRFMLPCVVENAPSFMSAFNSPLSLRDPWLSTCTGVALCRKHLTFVHLLTSPLRHSESPRRMFYVYTLLLQLYHRARAIRLLVYTTHGFPYRQVVVPQMLSCLCDAENWPVPMKFDAESPGALAERKLRAFCDVPNGGFPSEKAKMFQNT